MSNRWYLSKLKIQAQHTRNNKRIACFRLEVYGMTANPYAMEKACQGLAIVCFYLLKEEKVLRSVLGFLTINSKELKVDLKTREYGKSFDELLAKAKEYATQPGEELEILRDWILHDLSCRKSTREEKTENRPCMVKNKMKVISTKPCSDMREVLMICNGENEKASHRSSVRNDQLMKHKQSPNACCSKSSEDQDECFNNHKEASSPYASAWRKKKRQMTEDQDGYYYTYAGEVGNMINSTKTKKKVKKPRALPFDGAPPELPMEFRNKIESLHGSKAELVIHKEIHPTDVSDHHGRLNMPRNQVLTMEVLNEQEREEIEFRKHGLEVRVIQPCLQEKTLQLRKWSSPSGSYSCLKQWLETCCGEA